MAWYAHSLKGRPETEWETQCEHAERVAAATAARAGKFGFAELGLVAGRLHDLGKYTAAFQGHIAGRGPPREDRDHSSAGAVYARNRLGHPLGKVVAHIVAGHHAGLKDALLGEDQRLDRREAALGAVVRIAKGDGFSLHDPLPIDLMEIAAKKGGFGLAMLTRMMFSCLVDADRTETRTSETERLARAGLPRIEEDEPAFTATPADLAAELLRTMAERDAASRRDGTADDPINRLRARVRDHVAGQAAEAPGIFTLTVPTGGGKTLTSLRFALDHAKENRLDRVIVVIPFTGARIETLSAPASSCRSPGRSFTAARIETTPPRSCSSARVSPLHGGADRNIPSRALKKVSRVGQFVIHSAVVSGGVSGARTG